MQHVPAPAALLPDEPYQLLELLDTGLAVTDEELTVLWTNPSFQRFGIPEPVGHGLADALPAAAGAGGEASPWARARGGQPARFQVQLPDDRHLDVRTFPYATPAGARRLVRCRDVTPMVRHGRKLEALHQAGSRLAALHPTQLADMSQAERSELLKLNLRRCVHELLHYDVIEVRLLDCRTNELVPLLTEGMTAAASTRVLRAEPTGNGVTGLVAATGRSYLCPDTARDPHYLEGAAGARSSMTVPLLVDEEVIGTLNVESPKVNGFTPEDLQFAELFSREVAQALHTLDLLSAQERCAASGSVAALVREVALPADDILAAATVLLRRPQADATELAGLDQIVAAARTIKQSLCAAGPAETPPGAAEAGGKSRLKGLRLLVVDGDERTRLSAHTILDRFGCLVETARTGAQGLDLAGTSTYDAIFMDIRLPDMTGYEAFRGFRQAQPAARPVFMSGFGYDSTHSIVHARQEGLRFVIFKPLRPEQVLDALLSPDRPAPASAR